MDLNKIAEMKEALGIDKVEKFIDAQTEKSQKEAQAKAEQERREKEETRMKALVDGAIGEQKELLNGALDLIKGLTEKLGDHDIEGFSKSLEALQGEVAAKSEEIQQLMAAGAGFAPTATAVKRAFQKAPEDLEDLAEKATFLGFLMQKDVFDTDLGAQVREKVNQSSNIEVSSDEYETIFSTRILRDIQDALIVGDMFDELPMSAANITLPIEPTAGMANWVAASTYGTDATTGNEINVALTEITFSTFKLAAKAYITDETTEDAIIPLLPIPTSSPSRSSCSCY